MSLFNQKDVAALVAINERGIFIIDPINSVSFIACQSNYGRTFDVKHFVFFSILPILFLDLATRSQIRRIIMGLREAECIGWRRLFTLYFYSGKQKGRRKKAHMKKGLASPLTRSYSPFCAVMPPDVAFKFLYLCSIQFDAVENGMSVSKMMQVFSKQAPMMDALISHFAEQMRRRREGENGQPPGSLIDGA